MSGAGADRLDRGLHALALAGVFGGLLVPLVYAPGSVVFPFVFAKGLALQALAGLSLPAWLALAWRRPEWRPPRGPVTWALAAHLAALGLAGALGADPLRAFWGSQERMGGLFQQLHLAGWLLMAASLLRDRRAWPGLLRAQVVLGVVMAAVALLQLPFPGLLGFTSDHRVSGLLGNPIFSGAWHVLALGFAALLWLEGGRGRRWLLLPALASAAAIAAAGSRGPLLGLAAGGAAGLACLAHSTGRRRLLLRAFTGLGLAAAAWALVAVVLAPLPALAPLWKAHPGLGHLFLADLDPGRRGLWRTAWEAFLERPLLGWGPGAFSALFDARTPAWFACHGAFDDFDSAHSVAFDLLAGAGLAGLATWAGLWAAALVALVRAGRSGALAAGESAVLVGLATAYLVQGLFIFDSPGVSLLAALVLSRAAAAQQPGLAAPAGSAPGSPRAGAGPAALAFAALEAAAALLVIRTTALPALASREAMRASAALARSDCAAALGAARAAAALPTPWLEDQHHVLAQGLLGLAQGPGLERCPQWRELLRRSRALAEALAGAHPAQARIRLDQANLLFVLGRASGDRTLLDEAGPAYRALAAGSRRPLYRFDLARWLLAEGRPAEARAELEAAAAQDPESGDALWRLGRLRWRSAGEPGQGAALMARAMRAACSYPLHGAAELEQLADAWALLGDREGLRGLPALVASLPPGERQLRIFLSAAQRLEDAGLRAERDRVVALALEAEPSAAARLAPLLDGRAPTLAEALRLTPPAPR